MIIHKYQYHHDKKRKFTCYLSLKILLKGGGEWVASSNSNFLLTPLNVDGRMEHGDIDRRVANVLRVGLGDM
jgi:hypothetical protein